MISTFLLFVVFVVGLVALMADLVKQHRLERQEARVYAGQQERARARRITYPERRTR